MVTLEMAVSILLGRVQGYTETFPTGPFVYTGICTLAVDVMLFFSELLLMLIFDNPLPALCVGIVGALIGLFSAFMRPLSVILCRGATLSRCPAMRLPSGTRPPTL